jgi:metal-responsive CopG/Arc/MetJ family transcriptional regulator
MPQLTVRLPDDISEALDAAARRLQRKRAEVVRMALRRFLALDRNGTPADRVRSLLGSLSSGTPDLAEHHRGYVLESLSRER